MRSKAKNRVADDNEIWVALKKGYNLLGVIKRLAVAKNGIYDGLDVVEQMPGSEISIEYNVIADMMIAGKFEKEDKWRASVVGSITEVEPEIPGVKKGWPKEDRETKKRVSLSMLPSLYEDIQKIAYIQRMSTSNLIAMILEQYREEHGLELAEYEALTKDSRPAGTSKKPLAFPMSFGRRKGQGLTGFT